MINGALKGFEDRKQDMKLMLDERLHVLHQHHKKQKTSLRKIQHFVK